MQAIGGLRSALRGLECARDAARKVSPGYPVRDGEDRWSPHQAVRGICSECICIHRHQGGVCKLLSSDVHAPSRKPIALHVPIHSTGHSIFKLTTVYRHLNQPPLRCKRLSRGTLVYRLPPLTPTFVPDFFKMMCVCVRLPRRENILSHRAVRLCNAGTTIV